ncbi:MAG: peptide deformylase [Alphaproteobacteria bacterium]|nr:peptide deformylase [Alphaproteobacteria bacterium]
MARRAFLPWGDPRLRKIAAPVDAVNDAVCALWSDMIDTMYAMPGVGLAAPQIGEMLRLAVVDCSSNKDQPLRMANPEILHTSGKMSEYDEASPNLPGVSAKIKRPRALTVAFLNAEGARVEQDFVGLWATSVQHQIDHLNGRMFFDHLSAVKRRMLLAKAAKLARRG